ncbi:hypothetical protein [Mucilaginibacter gracilis]|uniref:hypothetical protein n=1 Tax=Mucilaginibacter gracilis TaxID=423350 RepID=UPI0013C2C190|nr:hypothetical protein [Mucilaginibacter gracilis]
MHQHLGCTSAKCNVNDWGAYTLRVGFATTQYKQQNNTPNNSIVFILKIFR